MKKTNKTTIIIISIIVIISICIYYFFIRDKDYVETNYNIQQENININKEEIKEKTNKIVVYMAGSVKKEGVFELEEKSRVSDGIEKAGGLAEDADLSEINLALLLEDGMKVYIPKKGEMVEDKMENTGQANSSGTGNMSNIKINSSSSSNVSMITKKSKVNINTATQTELETLPGVGPSTASKIISYRKENGKFNSIEDLKKVSGIGDSKFEKVKEFIKCN